MSNISSRERMLAALRYQEPDHVPLIFNIFGFQPPPHLAWSNQVEEAQRWLSLGVDATLKVSPPLVFHPDVTVREWEERYLPAEQLKKYSDSSGLYDPH